MIDDVTLVVEGGTLIVPGDMTPEAIRAVAGALSRLADDVEAGVPKRFGKNFVIRARDEADPTPAAVSANPDIADAIALETP